MPETFGDKLSRLVPRLSQGEKQRVAVCRALIAQPELILADEPTGSLDPANKRRVLDILSEYATESGSTLVTVTHDHDSLSRSCSLVRHVVVVAIFSHMRLGGIPLPFP